MTELRLHDLIVELQKTHSEWGNIPVQIEQTNDNGPEAISTVEVEQGVVCIIGDPFK